MRSNVIYYNDEINDDFASTVKKVKPLPKNYSYINDHLYFRILSFITYRMIARPFAYLYVKIKFHVKIKNKKVLKKVKGGYLIYGNHTTLVGDAFMCNILSVKKRNYILTGKETNSLSMILPLLKSIGSIPITDNITSNIDMIKCMKKRIEEKASITIFPERHIWPYYTKIRPFSHQSFKYAYILNCPVFAITTCYKKKLIGKKPRIELFVDGPFHPDKNLDKNKASVELRNSVYDIMKNRSEKESNYEYIKYVKVESNEGGSL